MKPQSIDAMIFIFCVSLFILLILAFKYVLFKLNSIILKQNTMTEQLDALKQKLEAQSAALDTVSTNVTGIGADVKFLKDKIGGLSGGATEAEIAEISNTVDSIGEKINAIGTATANLDAETDSSNPT